MSVRQPSIILSRGKLFICFKVYNAMVCLVPVREEEHRKQPIEQYKPCLKRLETNILLIEKLALTHRGLGWLVGDQCWENPIPGSNPLYYGLASSMGQSKCGSDAVG
ncbi:hypothetical protein KFK09_013675 [Dendrobium nobile]|uniref:Uncharacterized protein n=1 Tax=Dendrobium nobile TaxID=94219 RepID=A0A8T3BDP0_DENNO|nr:hypothetical protein KFK09_013675 [Dendrobium nobile]